ncbi:MAG: hypothetical protein ACI91B_004929, partial [Planctomycetota bacterium]
ALQANTIDDGLTYRDCGTRSRSWTGNDGHGLLFFPEARHQCALGCPPSFSARPSIELQLEIPCGHLDQIHTRVGTRRRRRNVTTQLDQVVGHRYSEPSGRPATARKGSEKTRHQRRTKSLNSSPRNIQVERSPCNSGGNSLQSRSVTSQSHSRSLPPRASNTTCRSLHHDIREHCPFNKVPTI